MLFADVLEIKNGRNQRAVENPNGAYPIYGSGGVMGYADDFICQAHTVVIGRKGNINKPLFVDVPFWNVDTAFGLEAKRNVLLPKYLYYFCLRYDFEKLNKAVTIPSLTKADLLKIEIELPKLSIQEDIVSRLESIERVKLLRQYQLRTLDTLINARFVELFGDPEYNNQGLPIKKLSELCNVGSSKRIYQEEQTIDGVPFWRISDLVAKMDTGNVDSSLYIPERKYEELKMLGLVPKPGDILVTSRGTLGRCYIVAPNDRFYFQDGMISWLSDYSDEITPLYIQYLFGMSGFRKQIDSLQAGSTVAYLSIAMLKKLNVMLPERKLQEQFAAFVSHVDKSKSVVQAALDKAQMLFDSLMQQYFG